MERRERQEKAVHGEILKMLTSELLHQYAQVGDCLKLSDFLGFPPAGAMWAHELAACLIPAPYDGTTCARPGARFGPAALLTASCEIEILESFSGRDFSQIPILTLPALPVAAQGPEAMVARVEDSHRLLLSAGLPTVMIGGEHSLTIGAFAAHREREHDLVYVSFDAHADMRESYQGTKFSHACVSRRASERSPVVLLGCRSISRDEWGAINHSPQITLRMATELRGRRFPQDVLDVIDGRPVYLTIDLDVFDPPEMPAVGTPEPGGLGWYDVLDAVERIMTRSRIAGFDIMELAPIAGLDYPNYFAARLLQVLLGRWLPECKSQEGSSSN